MVTAIDRVATAIDRLNRSSVSLGLQFFNNLKSQSFEIGHLDWTLTLLHIVHEISHFVSFTDGVHVRHNSSVRSSLGIGRRKWRVRVSRRHGGTSLVRAAVS